MKTCLHVCGVIFDPLDEDYVDVCEQCGSDSAEQNPNESDIGSESYYLGGCGLIFDYLL
ncbi:hypothetical protein [Paenibacillus hexagrammi]|uniref:Uncharacterized protein n=1 Tax=Paenibacillus hexagrammi TaxID=2908839 RepID=A0ABY3SPI0_9BACL|nr:hypothetical protein [Paenibacillus sp. YPD9-1]UJF35420.1 hypothetical protein L0M14_10130 [Paenibacillus sp. YPD9-1]